MSRREENSTHEFTVGVVLLCIAALVVYFAVQALRNYAFWPWGMMIVLVAVIIIRRLIAKSSKPFGSQESGIRASRALLHLGKQCLDRFDKAKLGGDTRNETDFHKQYLPGVKNLLEKGADVDFAFSSGQTLLMLAAGAGHYALAAELVKAGAAADRKDNDGKTALMYAARNAMVVYHTDDEDSDSGELFQWTAGGEVIRLLLQAGADVNEKDNEGKTALMHALTPHWGNVCAFVADGDAVRALTLAKIDPPLLSETDPPV